MIDFKAMLPLKAAGEYARPRRETQELPLVYGDFLSEAASGGAWEAVCLDQDSDIYCLAGHPVQSAAQGNQVRVWDRDGQELAAGSWTFDPAHDLEGRGAVATLSFPALTAGDISAAAGDNSLNSASGGFGFGAGWPIVTQGFNTSANNGSFKVIEATPHKLVVEGRDLSDEPAGATVEIRTEMRRNEPLAVRLNGKVDAAGELMANPLALARDLVVAVAGHGPEEIHATAWSRAWARAEALGYRAAGAVVRSQSLGQVLTGLMGDFLGSWWVGGDGRLRFGLDFGPGSTEEAELGFSLRQAALKGVEASASLEEVVNAAGARLAYDWVAREHALAVAADDHCDRASIGLFGRRERELELSWVRSRGVAATICDRLVGLLGQPRQSITCTHAGLTPLALELGDAALLSLDWLYDRRGRPLKNQIVRCLGLEPDLDQAVTRLTLWDTGYFKTLAFLADGSHPAGGVVQAGGQRDRSDY